MIEMMMTMRIFSTISQRLKLKGETENMGVRTKERKGVNSRGTQGHSLH